MGTSQGLQRLVDPMLQTQTNVWILDRDAWRVCRRGEWQRVHGRPRPTIRASTRLRDTVRVNVRVWKAPFAPLPPASLGGASSQFFLTFSLTMFFQRSKQWHTR